MLLCTCSSANKPTTSTGRALQPVGEQRGAQEGAFRVVFAAPRGEAAAGAELSLVFSQALRGLEEAKDAPELPLSPRVPGKFRYVGTRALVFVPDEGQLPGGTAFRLEVPKGFRSVTGGTLAEPFVLQFETPRPRLTGSEPRTGAEGVLPGASLELTFNQAVTPEQVQRFGRLVVNGRALGFASSRPRDKELNVVSVKPREVLPRDRAVEFVLDAGLLGAEGPLTAGIEQKVSFQTLAPLHVTGVECSREKEGAPCFPGSSLGVMFSSPVLRTAAEKLVRVESSELHFEDHEATETTTYLDLPVRLAPGRTYTVRLGKGLVDIHGQRMDRDFAQTLKVADLAPAVAVGLAGAREGTLVPATPGLLPVGAVNAREAALVYAALSPEDVLRFDRDQVAPQDFLQSKAGRVQVTLPLGVRNRMSRADVDLSKVLGAQRGPVALESSFLNKEGAREKAVQLMRVSDLALSAKFSRHGSELWVTHLSSGKPEPGAKVALWLANGKRFEYAADAAGRAAIPARDFAPKFDYESPDRKALLFVTSQSGTDWTYERLSDVMDSWSLPVPVDDSGELAVRGLLFSDRGVYRPGEVVQVKGIVRRDTARGSAVPVNEKVTLALNNPSGEEVSRTELTVSRYGTFNAAVNVPKLAELGDWVFTAALGQQKLRHAVGVLEYRPQEFKVDVSAPATAIRGQRVDVRVIGEYLYGAKMAGAQANYQATRSEADFTPEGRESFVTNALDYYADSAEAGYDLGVLSSQAGALDATGVFVSPLELSLPSQRGAERVVIEGEVQDVSRQSGAHSTSILVHPADFYLGLERPPQSFVDAPSVLEPGVLALEPSGKAVAGRKVRLELVQRRYTYAHEDRGGAYPALVSKRVERVLSSCELTTAATKTSCKLPLNEPGYVVVRARSQDNRGNPVEAALGYYAFGAGEASFASRDAGDVELVLDRKTYRVGQKARVLVKSPFPEAEAWITIERADLQRSERKVLRGSMPWFELDVTEDMRPNAFVSVALWRPIDAARSRTPGAAYRMGYAELRVEPESRRLAVHVKPSVSAAKPGDEVGVDLQVLDHQGKPADAELALYVVDEGVLMLSGYKTPDPAPVFSAPRPLQVMTLETRQRLAYVDPNELNAVLGIGKGAPGGGGGEGAGRSDFRSTALYVPSLVTDAQGRAKTRFKLPDNLTRYRVMAVAAGKADAFGFGAANLTVSRKLMARPALPRFLRAGDVFDASVVVSAKAFDPGDVTTKLSVDGLTPLGASVAQVRPGRDGQREVRFRLRADRAGEARLTFDVAGNGEKDRVTSTRAVQIPSRIESVALSGSTAGVAEEKLGALGGLRSDVGALDLSLASSALVGVDAALTSLADYPYSCTEQLASRLLPAGPLASLSRDYGFSGLEALNRSVPTLMRDILARQRGDGGFGWWPGDERSEPWVTAYALWALHGTQRSDAKVPAQAFEDGKRYLREWLTQMGEAPERLAIGALALDVLARLGAPDAGYLRQVYGLRARLPLFARALLLDAVSIARLPGPEQAELVRDLEQHVRVLGATANVLDGEQPEVYAALLDSSTRTQAMVLLALVGARPHHPLLVPLARGLLDKRVGGTFRTTQEAGFGLLALDAYRKSEEAATPEFEAEVRLGDARLFQAEFKGRGLRAQQRRIEMATLMRAAGQPLRFERDGSGTLFYQARLSYARAALPEAPLDAGFYVERRRRPVTPTELSQLARALPPETRTSFAGADWVLTELTVTSSEAREFVVIDDPIPAGFETVDSALVTSSGRYAALESTEEDSPFDAEGRWREGYSSRPRRELRDDRAVFFVDHMAPGIHRFRHLARATTLGQFVVPPPHVEAMYAPEHFGRGAKEVVEVK
ncbi:MAG TPA: alpha-2-macroglobulin family protein [Polyangiaceae bacterium]|nr:alpha-2-macroglobulin family protein [Polyangiaceae bacterium]